VGALDGVTVVELAGLGALPFATLKLADMGADVIRVNRTSEVPPPGTERVQARHREFDRGRRSIAVDLKHPRGVETVLRLAERSQVLLESMRPGVAERLGVGPDVVLSRNPSIVYGRLTGWGQDGPLAHAAGHSLNYEALCGAVGAIGPRGGPPVPLLQVLGDFAGGGLHLAYGVVCALFQAQRTGVGQVVDAAMVDGVLSLFSVFYSMAATGVHAGPLGTNLFDGGAPFYGVYETADGRHVTVAPIEDRFYEELLQALGIDASEMGDRDDPTSWPRGRTRLAAAFAERTLEEWRDRLEGTDVCFAPVVPLAEVPRHPHHVARQAFIPTPDGGVQVAPSPRLSATPGTAGTSYAYPGVDTDTVLAAHGFADDEIADLHAVGAVA